MRKAAGHKQMPHVHAANKSGQCMHCSIAAHLRMSDAHLFGMSEAVYELDLLYKISSNVSDLLTKVVLCE